MSGETDQAQEVSDVKLVILRGGRRGRSFVIEPGSHLVGRWDPERGAYPEIDLEADDPESKISRKHAVIERVGDEITITDLGSRNGTFVNRGERLEHGLKHSLEVGDEIIIGKILLKLEVG